MTQVVYRGHRSQFGPFLAGIRGLGVRTQGLPVLIIIGSTKIDQKRKFPGNQNRPLSAFLGPPGPRDPEKLVRHDLLYNLIVLRSFLVGIKQFPGHFSVFTLRKHSPKIESNKALGPRIRGPRGPPRPGRPGKT